MTSLGPSGRAVLIIAGSDSSAGAGVARDLLVLRDHRCEARVALTAITAQTSRGVQRIHGLCPALVREQILAAASDQGVGAIKIGMLANAEIVDAVASCLTEFPDVPVVLDPVLASSSATALLDAGGTVALQAHLAPKASLVTPNRSEAAILLGQALARNDDDAEAQARALHQSLGCAVLVKGGHGAGEQATDILVGGDGGTRISDLRLDARMRGTGCALSTAIAIAMSQGQILGQACRAAKDYVRALLAEHATRDR